MSFAPARGKSPEPSSRPPAAGFTLLELLIVIGVMMTLAGISFPIYLHMRVKAKLASTRVLVETVATAIANYQQTYWTVVIPAAGPIPAQPRVGHLWDMNSGVTMIVGDGILDGYVGPGPTATATNDGPFDPALIATGYTGFLNMTQAPIAKRNVNAMGQVIDDWKNPLHIGFSGSATSAAINYGPSGVGIWSLGPDGVTGTPDDICSWKTP